MTIHKIIRIAIVSAAMLVGFSPLLAQGNLDSLEQSLSLKEADTLRYKKLTNLAWGYSRSEPDRALEFAKKARALALTMGSEREIAHVNYYFGVINKNKGNFTQALADFEPYTTYFKKIGDKRSVCFVYYQTGIIKSQMGNFKSALEDFYANVKLAKELGLKETEANTLNAIATVYRNIKNYDKAIELNNEAMQVYIAVKDSIGVAKCLGNNANIYTVTNRLDEAEANYLRALELLDKTDDDYSIGHMRYNLGKLYLLKNKQSLSYDNFTESLSIRKKLGHNQDLAISYIGLGSYYLKVNDGTSAIINFKQGLGLANETKSLEQQRDAVEGLAKANASINNYQESNRYYQLFSTYADSLLNSDITRQVSELNIQFETLKKQQEIDEQNKLIEKKNRQRKTLIAIIAGLAFLSIMTAIILRRKIQYQRMIANQQEKIKEQRILELQRENKLLAMNSMMEGQEAERLRIAKDLHDGLGGLLSTVKAHFSKIQEEISKIETLNVYHKANHLIDEACIEVRRIAHNMTPHSLTVTGLGGAIEDLSSDLAAQGLQCNFDYKNLTATLSDNRAIMLYRIIQELTHNVVKHAKATELFVQLYNKENTLHITIEDNGCGFDVNEAFEKKGVGLKSIDSRVKYLSGSILYDSVADKGTTVTIEIPIHD